jgi:hypothetical protein
LLKENISHAHCPPALYKTQYMTGQPLSCSNTNKERNISADTLWLNENLYVLWGMISGTLYNNVYFNSQLDSVSNGRNTALYLPM